MRVGGQHADLDEFGWQVPRSQVLYYTALACRMAAFAYVLACPVDGARLPQLANGGLRSRAKKAVDRDVLEKLEAPLTHLLRNAVDHGIEMPEQRVLAGKPAEGLIRLRASHQAGLLVLELSDDGNGVDLERLRGTIVERHLSTEETTRNLSEEELLTFLSCRASAARQGSPKCPVAVVGLDAVQHMVRPAARRGGAGADGGAGSRFPSTWRCR